MKDVTMEWMITQIFLSDTGVHEVYINGSNHRLKCDCPGYMMRSTCKHVNHVKEKMNINGGVYPTEISNKISREESMYATSDPKAFREVLINYGKIIAL